jgi:hypothetical protein
MELLHSQLVQALRHTSHGPLGKVMNWCHGKMRRACTEIDDVMKGYEITVTGPNRAKSGFGKLLVDKFPEMKHIIFYYWAWLMICCTMKLSWIGLFDVWRQMSPWELYVHFIILTAIRIVIKASSYVSIWKCKGPLHDIWVESDLYKSDRGSVISWLVINYFLAPRLTLRNRRYRIRHSADTCLMHWFHFAR